jgi:hypothetical protein
MPRPHLGAERLMPNVYIYVVARDFGFAPNPFHGVCTLATCKPVVRKTAQIGDWVVGMGGAKLKAVGRCIFAMQLTDTRTFDAYWEDPMFHSKRPVRNGTRKTIMGDNIYHQAAGNMAWIQEDSHHSQVDGSPEPSNIKNDTQTNRVLISHNFYYFGSKAPLIPREILNQLGYSNGRGHRKLPIKEAKPLLSWINSEFKGCVNAVIGDPHQFMESNARYSKRIDRIID